MKITGAETYTQAQQAPSTSTNVTNTDIAGDKLKNAKNTLAQDAYHKSAPTELPSIYSKPLIISSNSQTVTKSQNEYLYESGLAFANLYFPSGAVHKAAEKMDAFYQSFMAELSNENPGLADKKWGFSIDKSGYLNVSGDLSSEEKIYIEEKLNSNDNLVSATKDFKAVFLQYTTMETLAWGRYQVNDSNFDQVFDLRSMLSNAQGDNDFKKAWGKSFSFLALNDNITQQLNLNAKKV